MSPQYVTLKHVPYLGEQMSEITLAVQVHAGAPYPQTLQYSQVYIKKVHAIVLALAKRTHFGKQKLKHKLSVREVEPR